MNDVLLPRHVAWRRAYDQRRYARHLSQPELNQRLRDIFLNLLRLTPQAKIGVLAINPLSALWIEKWTHALEEMQLRHGPYPAGFTREILHSEPFPGFASVLAGKAARAIASHDIKPGETFIKFGKRMYMERLYERGALRIQPATYFAATDHNGAVRDDELSITVSIALDRDEIVKLVRNPQDVPGQIDDQRVDVQFRWPTDYWLYCVSTSVEPRLFVDFQADSCVVIRNRSEFIRRVQEAAARLLPGSTVHEGAAIYLDPLFPSSPRVFVPFAKHFRYAYQEEYRFCWLPREGAQRLEHIDIEAGKLSDIADLIVL